MVSGGRLARPCERIHLRALGGRIGCGRNAVSWISCNVYDLLDIYHLRLGVSYNRLGRSDAGLFVGHLAAEEPRIAALELFESIFD